MSDAAIFPASPRLEDYLLSTAVIDADHPSVVAEARRLTASCQGDVAIVRRLFEFVRDEVSHTCDVGGRSVTCIASEVLAQRTGICFAKSHLLAALLRAVGVPAGFVYQQLRQGPPATGFVLHGLNGAYLASVGRWVRFDARGNKPGVDAQFDLDCERLAFPTATERGERIDPAIYPAPNARIVAALSQCDKLEDVWARLPSELRGAQGL